MSRIYTGLKPPPCRTCGKPILRQRCQHVTAWQARKYCSHDCARAANAKRKTK